MPSGSSRLSKDLRKCTRPSAHCRPTWFRDEGSGGLPILMGELLGCCVLLRTWWGARGVVLGGRVPGPCSQGVVGGGCSAAGGPAMIGDPVQDECQLVAVDGAPPTGPRVGADGPGLDADSPNDRAVREVGGEVPGVGALHRSQVITEALRHLGGRRGHRPHQRRRPRTSRVSRSAAGVGPVPTQVARFGARSVGRGSCRPLPVCGGRRPRRPWRAGRNTPTQRAPPCAASREAGPTHRPRSRWCRLRCPPPDPG